jgi:hypothetical protein
VSRPILKPIFLMIFMPCRCVPATVAERQWLKELVEGGVMKVHPAGKSEPSLSFEYLLAHFGSRVPHQDVMKNLVMSKPAEACEPLDKDVKGKAVLVRRGSCSFVHKAEQIQNAGGVAMIVSSLHSHLLRMVRSQPASQPAKY